ncbi:hypothetical protein SAMN05421819_3535 [Bryocella elongata]|uniref:Uncharacterized protein n=1 Tax=Bryocella elongata TaxID=863522 RepID=A0A1H6B5R0_9BACT|nr:hypothetical protein SAMN05421819_3535 [Bryocella elongata]
MNFYAKPGTCQYCGCTREEPCKLADGDECAFLNSNATRCSNPDCVRADEEARARDYRKSFQRRNSKPSELREKVRRPRFRRRRAV